MRSRHVVLVGLFLSCGTVIASQNTPNSGQWNGQSYDQYFAKPYIDVDEWRDTPVRHRYVHGGFKGTDTLFSMYFPPKEKYQGRFFQPLAAVSGNENGAQQQIAAIREITNENTTVGFAIASGGYLIESNLGAKNMYDNRPLTMWPASAATAKYSRVLAQEMYGGGRPYGYLYGGSGGAFKTINAFESTVDVWDGAVPYVIGAPIYDPNNFSVQAHAWRVLKDKWRDVVDAIDPGGSGDMYATLNQEEREALREATRYGMPPRTWFAYNRLGYGPFAVLIDGMVARDPGYFEDFWKVPGYLGANPTESFKRARIQIKTTIARIVMSDEARKLGMPVPMAANGTNVVPAAFKLAEMPKSGVDMKGATLIMTSGGAAGQVLSISSMQDDLIAVSMGSDAFRKANTIKVGDEVQVDNSVYLAAQTYHRHQDPGKEFYSWNQYRGADGKPLYPLRPLKLRGEAQGWQTGTWQKGKMIVVESLVDELAYPWQADWYRSKVKAHLGARFDQEFRLWFTDNAMHGGPSGRDRTRIVSYTEVLQQALRDLAAWVEKGVPPPASTSYKMVDDAQVVVPATAAERKGIQPVVALTANGGARAEVKVGEPVTFSGVVEAPPKTGKVVDAKWDFEGTGDYPVAGEVKVTSGSGERATVTTTYTFSKPGTYFPALLASSQRTPDDTPYARVKNLARVRVVVR